MKNILHFILFLVFLATPGMAQIRPITIEPDGGNRKASISEQIGIVNIAISYSRPGVKGREGKIWNTPVAHYGFADQGHGTSTAAPWRAGANENTTMSFSHPVKIEGKDLPAGTYGFFISLGEEESTLIFSKISTSWGSFYYDPAEDALRVSVKNQTLDSSVEWLKYEFIEQREKYCVIALQWEYLSFPFRVDVDVDNIVIAKLRDEVTSQKGFNQLNLIAAANYCLNKNINLEEALAWTQRASGLKAFGTLSTLSNAYTKNNKLQQADSAMNEALIFANPNQYLNVGRAMITAKRLDRALEIFNANQEKKWRCICG